MFEDEGLDPVTMRACEPCGAGLVRHDEGDPRGNLALLARDRERLHVGAAPADQDADLPALAQAEAVTGKPPRANRSPARRSAAARRLDVLDAGLPLDDRPDPVVGLA